MTSVSGRDKAILIAGLVSDRIGLVLLYIVFGPLARELGLTEIQYGILIASANVTLGFASPYWGRRSQVLGRRTVFVIGLSGFALGFLLLALVLQAGLANLLAPGPLFIALLAVRLGYGLVAAATQPAATAWIADVTAADSRTRGMALLGIAAGVGTILGPVLGGVLTSVDAVLPLYLAAGIAAVAAVSAWAGLREPERHVTAGPTARLRVTDPRIWPYLASWCLGVLVLTGTQTIFVFYIDDRFLLTDREVVAQVTSVALLAMGAAILFTQSVVLQAFRVPPAVLLRGGFLLLAAAMLLLLFAPGLIVVYVAFAVIGFGASALSSGLNAAATLSVTPAEQGAVAGLLAAAPILGMVIGPVLSPALYGVNPDAPLIVSATACLVTAGWLWLRRVTAVE